MTRRALVGMVLLLAACGGGTAATTTIGTTTTSAPTNTSGTTTTGATTTTVTTAAGRVVTVVVSNGAVQGGLRRESFSINEKATITVRSDVADEVHLHGYDQSVDVEAGGSASIDFVATIPGVFEMELEGRHLKLLELEVK